MDILWRKDKWSDVSSISETNWRTLGGTAEEKDFHVSFRFNVYIPIMTSILLLVFASLPFFYPLSVSRVRLEKISFVSELLKRDIIGNLNHVLEQRGDVGKKSLIDKLNLRVLGNFKDVKDVIESIYELCQRSIWAKGCKVDFMLPDLAVVDFVEVEPAGFLIDGDKVFLISSYAEKLPHPISISYIYEVGLNKISLPFIKIESQRCSIEEVVSLIAFMRNSGADFVDQVVCLDFSFELFTKDGYKVILPKDNADVAFTKFMKLRDEMKADSGKLSEVDVRGVEKIFVK